MLRLLSFCCIVVVVAAATGSSVDPASLKDQAASRLFVALDVGNEWLKLAVINKHAPPISLLDVVINEQSNRKTPSLIGFDNEGDRVFGEAAVGLMSRNPGRVFPALKRVLSHKVGSKQVQQYAKDYDGQHAIEADAAGGVVFKLKPSKDGDVFPSYGANELAAMTFELSKKLIADHSVTQGAGSAEQIAAPYLGVVVVPDGYTQQQRELIGSLSAVGGIQTVATLSELTAAAIDYAVRVFKESAESKPQTHVVFYGVGSMGASASLVHLSLDKAANTVAVKVVAKSSDELIGGLNIDLLLRDELAKRVDAKDKVKSGATNPDSVYSSAKAMAKLLREAREMKEQLSVSPLFQITLEELFNGKDFTATIKVEEFDALIRPLLPKFIAPLQAVLAQANAQSIDISSISGIELFGGGVRVPAIQEAIKAAAPNVPIGRHVDGDEAALLGAAYFANGLREQALSLKSARLRVTVEESITDGGASSDAAAAVLNEAQVAAVKDKLVQLEARSAAKREWLQTKNQLESLVVDLNGQIAAKKLQVNTDAGKALQAALTQAAALISALEEDYSHSTPVADIKAELIKLQQTAKPVQEAAPKAKRSSVDEEEDEEVEERKREQGRDRRRREKEKRKKEQEKEEKEKSKKKGSSKGKKGKDDL